MPNWCENRLEVSGDTEELKKFLEAGIKEEPTPHSKTGEKQLVWRMSRYYPIPEKLKETTAPTLVAGEELIKEFGFDNWYDWCVSNWGTKWDCSSEDMGYQTDNETYFNVEFNSAWSPPTNWFKNVAKQYPKLNFRLVYMEEGCWFAGVIETDEDDNIMETEGEPEHQDENGNVFIYDDEKDVYVCGDTIITSDEYFEQGIMAVNPFNH